MGTYQVRDDYDGWPGTVEVSSDRITMTWNVPDGRDRVMSYPLSALKDCGRVTKTLFSHAVWVEFLDEDGGTRSYYWKVKKWKEMLTELDFTATSATRIAPRSARTDRLDDWLRTRCSCDPV